MFFLLNNTLFGVFQALILQFHSLHGIINQCIIRESRGDTRGSLSSLVSFAFPWELINISIFF